jgi:4-hydroxybenzoate polyprenyltransferase
MQHYWLISKKLAWEYELKAREWLKAHGPGIRERAMQYSLLMRMDKPIGTLLLLWPTLWALFIATGGLPSVHLLLVFIAGVFLTRSAGCVMNDYADRDFDRHVARTRERPITTGRVNTREAFYLIAVLLAIAFLLVLTTNRLTIILSFIALPIGGFYPFMKRYIYFPQLFQGIAFGWGIPMAFAAATDTVPRIAWLLYMCSILWSLTYDTMYAMVDREDDKKIGIKSTAILFEESDRFFIGIIQLMMLAALVLVGTQLKFGDYYFSSLLVVAGLMLYQQYLIKDRLPAKCFSGFLSNNWLGAVVFIGIVLHYYSSIKN